MRNSQVFLLLALCAFVCVGGAVPVFPQGRTDYMNVETPQVHPIEIARVGGHDFLLMVNTPDHSLEIWDTDESIPLASRFVARVRTGLEPGSVLWVPELSRAYVSNFLGDSITMLHLGPSDGPSPVNVTMIATQPVADEPLAMDFAYTDVDGEQRPTLFVTHKALDGYGTYHAKTLEELTPGSSLMPALTPSGQDLDFDGVDDDIAIKEPWVPEVRCGKLWVLGHKGGNTVRYDFDLYSKDLVSGATADLGGLGSHQSGMAFASDDTLFIVGGEALNTLRDEPQVAAAPTGFVKSMFYRVDNVCSGNPTVMRRDVNRRKLIQSVDPTQVATFSPEPGSIQLAGSSGGASPSGGVAVPIQTTGPVPKGRALAQLTDVVPLERDGTIDKVFFTAFSSDRIGVIEPDPSIAPINWKLRRINIVPLSAGMSGPRGLALKQANPFDPNDPGARLYVLNRVDQSWTIIDPIAESVIGTQSLQADPTPGYITDGRELLYSAKLSGNGFSSCSSCHLDGRTDGLAWDLGDGMAVTIPRELLPNDNFADGVWRADKEFMVTQSLQGLLNWEVEPEAQKLFTNAPYHWRGDRADFTKFSPAFAALLGGSEPSAPDMKTFETFINSIHYPPNPKQPQDRIYSGELGDPDDVDTTAPLSGSDGLLGLKIFHTVQSDGNFSCVGCHALPVGSDNVLTEDIPGVNPHPLQGPPPLVNAPDQAIETAAMRGLFQKEARRDVDGSSFPSDSPITGYEGIFHTGLVESRPTSPDFHGTASINAFNLRFFNVSICPTQAPFCSNMQALNQFAQEFDFGVGPIVGESYNVTSANKGDSATQDAFDLAEQQAAEVNAGLIAQAWIGGAQRGFWYDLTVDPPVYREEPSGLGLTRAALLNAINVPRELLVLQSVPLGSERRLADPAGQPALQPGPAPTDVELEPMVPNSAYERVPELTVNWNPGGILAGGTDAHTVRLFQNALLIDGPSDGYGLCALRHEAPRRFRVSGQNIRHGAKMHLFVHDDLAAAGPPITLLGPEDQALGQPKMLNVVLPLHPTGETRAADGAPVWETSVEMEPQLFYALMAGRPDQTLFPGVIDELTDLDYEAVISPEAQPALTWSPASWNLHYLRVVNADGTSVDGGWKNLRIEPGPDCP